MINLYDNIRKRRQQLNMTQEQLAEKTGYASKSMISKIEKGLIKLDQEKIEDFAKALRMDPVELMGYVFEPFEPEVQKEIDAFMARQEENKEPERQNGVFHNLPTSAHNRHFKPLFGFCQVVSIP